MKNDLFYTWCSKKNSNKSSFVSFTHSKYIHWTQSIQQAPCYTQDTKMNKDTVVFREPTQSSLAARKKHCNNNKWWWKAGRWLEFYSQSHPLTSYFMVSKKRLLANFGFLFSSFLKRQYINNSPITLYCISIFKFSAEPLLFNISCFLINGSSLSGNPISAKCHCPDQRGHDLATNTYLFNKPTTHLLQNAHFMISHLRDLPP